MSTAAAAATAVAAQNAQQAIADAPAPPLAAPGPPQGLGLPADWRQCRYHVTGKTCYRNSRTGEIRWERPVPASLLLPVAAAEGAVGAAALSAGA